MSAIHHEIIAETAANKPTVLPPHKIKIHHPDAGINPLVDAANYVFSALGKLRTLGTYTQLKQLQLELLQEIDLFSLTLKNQGFGEMASICRYLLCALSDDILSHTSWGNGGLWEAYSLLAASHQDMQHQERFFAILERALKEPQQYIDLMEFLYICLSLGYKGKYRKTEHSQFQLEQIADRLYKHIRACRGDFSKFISPVPLKKRRSFSPVKRGSFSTLVVIILCASIIMALFIGLKFLMDTISDDTFKLVSNSETVFSQQTPHL